MYKILTVLGLSRTFIGEYELSLRKRGQKLGTSYAAKIMHSEEKRVTVPAVLITNGHL